jgi:dnd system-associated protein 4
MSLTRDIKGKNVRRNDKYKDVVSLLVYGDIEGEGKSEKVIFNAIKDLIVFSAMVGKKYERMEDVDGKNSTGIILDTFAGSSTGGSKGSRVDQHNLIFMFGLLHFKDVNYLRDENVNSVIDVFEKYSNGGLGLIRDWLVESGWNSLVLLDKISDEIGNGVEGGIVIEESPF